MGWRNARVLYYFLRRLRLGCSSSEFCPECPLTEQNELAEPAIEGFSSEAGRSGFFAHVHRPVLIAFAILVALVAVMHSAWYVDYVGKDNDDVMRLVMVRDLQFGQASMKCWNMR